MGPLNENLNNDTPKTTEEAKPIETVQTPAPIVTPQPVVTPATTDPNRDKIVIAAFEVIAGKHGQYVQQITASLKKAGLDYDKVMETRLKILNGEEY